MGASIAVSPVASGRDEEPRETVLVEAGEEEGVYSADFDMEEIRAYREREVWGNAFRKPNRYGLLASDKVRPSFIRKSARR